MIRLTLEDLLNHGRVGPLALGDPKSKIDAIEGLATCWNEARIGDGKLRAGWYRMGDFEIHCFQERSSEPEAFLFVLSPGNEETGRRPKGGGIFSINCRGIRNGQDISKVLNRLSDFSIARSRRRPPPEMQIYDVGRYGTALFLEEDDTTTWFTQFEVYDHMRRVAGRDG